MSAIRKRIARHIKNVMRARLEQILLSYREIADCIEEFRTETACDEYVQFWDELQRDNDEIMRNISKYAVMRCNR